MTVSESRRRIVYKILPGPEWDRASAAGRYCGSADDMRDGFIHFSVVHQLAVTAAKHFRGRDDLVLVAFDAEALGPSLKWEPSRGGDLFPHLYGSLDTTRALWTRRMTMGQDGIPQIPLDLPQC